MSIGKPDIDVVMPASCQSPRSSLPAFDLAAKFGVGRSYRALKTKRCLRSKSDKPRFARLLCWSPRIALVSPTPPGLTTPVIPAPAPWPEALSMDLARVYAARNCSRFEKRLVKLICKEL